MKLLPLKPMSNFDKFNNFMKIIEKHKSEHASSTAESFINQTNAAAQCITKNNTWDTILYKYRTKISEFVKGINRNNG